MFFENLKRASGIIARAFAGQNKKIKVEAPVVSIKQEEPISCICKQILSERDIENKEYQTKNDIKLKKLFPNCFN